MSDSFDYSQFEDEPESVGDDAIARLVAMVREQVRQEARVASLEEDLKKAKEQVRILSEVRLPELMASLEMKNFVLNDGTEIEIDNKLRCHLAEKNKEEGFKFLDETGNGNVIKRQFIIEFGKDEEKWARKFAADLKRRKQPLNTKLKRTVHTATLTSLIKSMLEEGVKVPMDVFGVHDQKFSRVKVSAQD